MDTIRNYLESLFIEVPKTTETEKLKSDLLANMEDHYHELIEEGKSEHEAIGAVIATFGSIDELLEELNLEKEMEFPQQETNVFDLEDAEHYWKEYRKASLQIAFGVFTSWGTLVSFLFFITIDGVALAFCSLFLGIAISVGLFIIGGMRYTKASRSMANLVVSSKVMREAALREDAYRRSFAFSLVVGIGLCVFSLFPIMASISGGFHPALGIFMFFSTASLGIFLLTYGSMIRNSYHKLTKDGFLW